MTYETPNLPDSDSYINKILSAIKSAYKQLSDKVLELSDPVLNYGGLVCAAGVGLTLADHGILLEAMGKLGVDYEHYEHAVQFAMGTFSGIAPGINFIVLEGIRKNQNYPQTDISRDPLSTYTYLTQFPRNLFTGVAAYFIYETIQRPSVEGMVVSGLSAGIATLCHVANRTTRERLESIVEQTGLQPQPKGL